MRKTTRTGSFFMILLFNILINFHLTIPGWILLILHFIIPEYIKWWYCLIYFGAFLLYMVIWMLFIRWISGVSNGDDPAPKENKNPYSSKGYVPIKDQIENKNPYSSTGYEPIEKSDHHE